MSTSEASRFGSGKLRWRRKASTKRDSPNSSPSRLLELVILAKEKSGKMTAVSVAKAAGLVVVLREEEGSKSAVGGILVEKPIYREQEALGLFQNKRHVGAA